MTHPLRVAENCTTHPLHKAQNLMTHLLFAPGHPPPPPLYFLTSPLAAIDNVWMAIDILKAIVVIVPVEGIILHVV